MSEPVKPWDIDWFICRANAKDVAFAEDEGKPTPAAVGDEMWRVARGIGPFSPDHDHWSGHNLGNVGVEDVVTAAYAPVMKRLLERIDKPDFNCAPHQFFVEVQEEARKILAEMKTAETRK